MQNDIIFDIAELLNIFDFENGKIDNKTFNKIQTLISYDIKQLISENNKDKRYYNFIGFINNLFIKLNIINDRNLSKILENAISNVNYERTTLIELKKYLTLNRSKLNQQQLKYIMTIFIYVALMDNNREQILANAYSDKEKTKQKFISYQKTIDDGMIKLKNLN